MPLDVISYSLAKRKAERFKQLRDTPDSYAGYASKFVIVRTDETGLTFGDAPGGGWTLKEVTSDYTASSNECVLANAEAGPITITLPTPSNGARVRVKKIDSSTNTVTVSPSGTEKIDGGSSHTISQQYEAYEYVSNGTDWYVFGGIMTLSDLTIDTDKDWLGYIIYNAGGFIVQPKSFDKGYTWKVPAGYVLTYILPPGGGLSGTDTIQGDGDFIGFEL